MTPYRLQVSGCLSAAMFSILLAGCVSEPGRSGPALWSKVESKENDDPPMHLRNPARVSVAYGKVQEQRGQLSEARQHYQSALSQNARSVDAILGIARLDQYAGRPIEAEKGFRRALKLEPKNPHAHDSLAMFFASQNRWTDAAESFQTALKGEPNNADYQKKMAIALAKTGNLAAAYQQFLTTVGEAEAHYYMGMILLERGQRSAASQQFQLALLNAPDMDAARKKLAELNGGQSPETLANGQPSSNQHNAVRAVGHATPQNAGNLREHDNRPDFGPEEQEIVISPGPIQARTGGQLRRRNSGDPVVIERANVGGYGGSQNAVILPADSQSGHGSQTLSPDQIQQWSNQYPAN